MKCVVDTNILLDGVSLESYEKIYVPMAVVEELDNHNHGANKYKAYKARRAMRMLENCDKVQVVRDNPRIGCLDNGKNDNTILACAMDISDNEDNVELFTADLNMKLKADGLGIPVSLYKPNTTVLYKGYKQVMLPPHEIAELYSCPESNKYDLLENQYLIVYEKDGNCVDVLKWSEGKLKATNSKGFRSTYFGNTTPKDEFQRCAFDSLNSKDAITVMFGKAGTGKSHIALSYLMAGLKNQKFNKIYIVYSFEPLKNNRELGYLPGDAIEKALTSGSLGMILSTKFGDIDQVKALVVSGQITIVPTANIRGVEFSENSAVYVTEAQNTDPYTIKTIIQRAKSGSKVILEGDMLEQRDIGSDIGGMERVIEVFKDTQYFSCVKLETNYRNPICEIANKIDME